MFSRHVWCVCRHYSTKAPRPVRGMADRIGVAERKYQFIKSVAQQTAEKYGYEPIHTPTLEYSSVFERTLGSDSDVVGKELYKLPDSRNQWMTMRPEGTAAVARALVTNQLEYTLPQKLYYSGPMYRHERPQRGRLRQFEQFGIESMGIPHPAIDVESILIGWQFLQQLPLDSDAQLELHLNTLGDAESRSSYRKALKAYFEHYRDKLSPDSQRRLDTNPLRILDSKSEQDTSIVSNAPIADEYLLPEAAKHFEFVQAALKELDIPFTHNRRLVRGLDYYQHTVWEVTCASSELGVSQATVLAGGRYDGLTSVLGGKRILPGVGWGSGIDRLALLLADSKVPVPAVPVPVVIIPEASSETRSRYVDDRVYLFAMRVAETIRQYCNAYVVHGSILNDGTAASHPSIDKQLANLLSKEPQPSRVVIVGTEEMLKSGVTVRNMSTRQQQFVKLDSIRDFL
ncbi:hypothetical protein EV183_005531 [Coemansia sp. RSA 2336]|nr:hypothetical protein EV183_005567 [Coemansia sp. RSA 2336]KAJ2448251.1 hypothetical protein EV183_005531 [Coemansia sp. RSA 2336]